MFMCSSLKKSERGPPNWTFSLEFWSFLYISSTVNFCMNTMYVFIFCQRQGFVCDFFFCCRYNVKDAWGSWGTAFTKKSKATGVTSPFFSPFTIRQWQDGQGREGASRNEDLFSTQRHQGVASGSDVIRYTPGASQSYQGSYPDCRLGMEANAYVFFWFI